MTSYVRGDLGLLDRACAQLKESKTFVKILEAVLTVGNHLNCGTFRCVPSLRSALSCGACPSSWRDSIATMSNGGSARGLLGRGAAAGFKLNALLNLVDIKGIDRKTSLLHFMIEELHQQNPLIIEYLKGAI